MTTFSLCTSFASFHSTTPTTQPAEMVSFQCDVSASAPFISSDLLTTATCQGCGDVVTRKKLDAHVARCRYPPVTCIDCHKTFHGNQHKSHTVRDSLLCVACEVAHLTLCLQQSCMTEAQKYEGPQQKRQKTPRNGPSYSNYKPPSVEDTPRGMQVAKVSAPPPAPSPPVSQPTPLNVFDFLVDDKNGNVSDSSAPSSPISPITRRISQSSISSAESSRPPTREARPKDLGISYGHGFVEHSLQRYTSDVSLAMDVDSQGYQTITRTPGPRHLEELKSGKRASSEKKRKRPDVEDLDLSDDKRASLHTGLTGGLGKLLKSSEFSAAEASPLSPKKRTKHSQYTEEIREPRQDKAHRSSKHKDEKKMQIVRKRDGTTRTRQLAVEGGSKPKAITNGPPSRRSFESHSEFFLSLIDKDHKSQRGQSIWGALKTFHEGVCQDDDMDEYDESGQRQSEEKRLLKALRLKRNKNGEYVLFARPDFEEPEETALVKRIEG